MSRELSRRRLLGTGVGMVGAAALGASPAAAHGGGHGHGQGDDHGGGRGHRLVPRDRLGVQQWSLRDATSRLNRSVSGYLGGPNFPEDPTDVGPLTPLAGGFAAVFEYLASVGYRGFEFFTLDQGANGPITTQQIRQALDAAGLVSAGSHQGGLQQMVGETYRNNQIEIAHTLGHRIIGTAGNPANPTLGTLAAWQGYAQQANTVGAALRAAGLKYSSTPSRTGSGSSTTRPIPSSRACTGSTGSPTTPTRATSSSSPTRCTRSGVARASSIRSTAASST